MKHQTIARSSAAWLLLGPAPGPRMRAPRVHAGQSAQEVADALAIAAGEIEIAATRAW